MQPLLIPSCIICLDPPLPTVIRHSSNWLLLHREATATIMSQIKGPSRPVPCFQPCPGNSCLGTEKKASELSFLRCSLPAISSSGKCFPISRSSLEDSRKITYIQGLVFPPSQLAEVGSSICQPSNTAEYGKFSANKNQWYFTSLKAVNIK